MLTWFPPGPAHSPVTTSGGFVLVKATPEAEAVCHASVLTYTHSLLPSPAQPIRIPTDQRRRSHSFSPVIVGSADKLQK